jgi:LacI family transcriptional regulator
MATMKQVAQRAGVSISTVSHVINETRAVSDEVRKRVLGIIDEMRYVPSAVARSLKNDKTNTIGVLVPNSSNPYFAELIRWIEDAAFELGYHIILCNAHGGARKQTSLPAPADGKTHRRAGPGRQRRR